MKSSVFVCAIVAASLSVGSLAFAQGQDRRQYDPTTVQRPGTRVDRHDDRRPMPANDPRWNYREDYRDGRHNDRREYYNARGPDFRRGGYIAPQYRSRQYVINNYRAYHLSAPPRGHQWVQVGADYALIAIATGLIASIVLSH